VKIEGIWVSGDMSGAYFTKRLHFWVRQALYAGLLVVGLYFINDSATPELYQLLIAFGLLGLLLYYFLGGGGSRGDGWKNEEDHEIDWVGGSRISRPPESSETSDSED
jgi:hypothetical protein